MKQCCILLLALVHKNTRQKEDCMDPKYIFCLVWNRPRVSKNSRRICGPTIFKKYFVRTCHECGWKYKHKRKTNEYTNVLYRMQVCVLPWILFPINFNLACYIQNIFRTFGNEVSISFCVSYCVISHRTKWVV